MDGVHPGDGRASTGRRSAAAEVRRRRFAVRDDRAGAGFRACGRTGIIRSRSRLADRSTPAIPLEPRDPPVPPPPFIGQAAGAARADRTDSSFPCTGRVVQLQPASKQPALPLPLKMPLQDAGNATAAAADRSAVAGRLRAPAEFPPARAPQLDLVAADPGRLRRRRRVHHARSLGRSATGWTRTSCIAFRCRRRPARRRSRRSAPPQPPRLRQPRQPPRPLAAPEAPIPYPALPTSPVPVPAGTEVSPPPPDPTAPAPPAVAPHM